jgi:hypothetical protein
MRSLRDALLRLGRAFSSVPGVHPVNRKAIADAQARLDHGRYRFVESAVALDEAWSELGGGEYIWKSDWGQTHGPDLEREFREEVSVFSKRLASLSDPPPVAEPEGAVEENTANHTYWRAMEAAALRWWRVWGMPYRVLEDRVVRIDAPGMFCNSPVMTVWPLRDFLVEATKRSALDHYRIWQLETQRNVSVWVALFMLLLFSLALRR